MKYTASISVVALLVVSSAAPAFGRVSGEQKCLGRKAKASALAVYAESQCMAQALLAGRAVDAPCLQKAEAKVREKFGKAEAKGACAGNVNDALLAARTCATAFAGATSGDARCTSRKLRAVGTRARGEAACAGKTPVCLTKVESKFAAALRKAERKGACTGTEAELATLLDVCDDPAPPVWTCSDGDAPTCNGTCPDGSTCRPYEVFADGASVETGCSCVDPVNAPACGEPVCSVDQACPDAGDVCEQWTVGDVCDHTVCQPAMVTPTTWPETQNTIFCDGGEFPTCGGTCPNGLRCQSFEAVFQGFAFFAGCGCVDPTGPRCETGPECDSVRVSYSHCADPSLTCIVDLAPDQHGQPDQAAACLAAHCGPGLPTTTSTSNTTITFPSTVTTTTVTTTTSTSSTTTTSIPCTSTPGVSGNFEDLGNCTVRDNGSGLEWEKKTMIPGPNHVNNRYVWAGCCADGCETMCQPNAAASATCLAMAADSPDSCGTQCPSGEECYVERGGNAITTIFDWINQLNAESFGGHDDWRLPTEAGANASGTRELESILQNPCAGFPCIDPIFGPTQPTNYWSRTTKDDRSLDAWFVGFFDGGYGNQIKREALYVRAVRGSAND